MSWHLLVLQPVPDIIKARGHPHIKTFTTLSTERLVFEVHHGYILFAQVKRNDTVLTITIYRPRFTCFPANWSSQKQNELATE